MSRRGGQSRASNNDNHEDTESQSAIIVDDEDANSEREPLSPCRDPNSNEIFRDEPTSTNDENENDDGDDDDDSYEEREMTLQELMYSSSSFYAIVVPVSFTMILSSLAVVYINNEATLAEGAATMAEAYQYFDTTNASALSAVLLSLLNGLIMVTVIALMTFVIVLLYKYNCMWILIGYMMFASTSLLGFLGGHIWYVAIQIYNLPVDKLTYFFVLWNFAAVGILSIFYGKGVPKSLSQGYLICTSVILAWHLSFFDNLMAWSLLFMLALYDLCAVLTPCGPLKALVNLMSRDDAPEMPGLLYEADLPPEARRPGVPSVGSSRNRNINNSRSSDDGAGGSINTASVSESHSEITESSNTEGMTAGEGPRMDLPLAIAQVYNLPVQDLPVKNQRIFRCTSNNGNGRASFKRPLLNSDAATPSFDIPENPSRKQLQADVTVQLPTNGGRIERIRRKGKNVFLERNRHGEPKRILWVDRQGRVFAESSEYGLRDNDDEEIDGRNSIRLGLGDFIFYSVMVAKAAEYSFSFCCIDVGNSCWARWHTDFVECLSPCFTSSSYIHILGYFLLYRNAISHPAMD